MKKIIRFDPVKMNFIRIDSNFLSTTVAKFLDMRVLLPVNCISAIDSLMFFLR